MQIVSAAIVYWGGVFRWAVPVLQLFGLTPECWDWLAVGRHLAAGYGMPAEAEGRGAKNPPFSS